MPKEPQERYMEWLEREEEKLGLGKIVRGMESLEAWKEMLKDELTKEALEEGAPKLLEWAKARYEILPEAGITTFWAPHPGGRHIGYRDIEKARFISYREVSTRIKEYWEEWGY